MSSNSIVPIVHVEGYNNQGKLVAITFDAEPCDVFINVDGWFQKTQSFQPPQQKQFPYSGPKYIGIGCKNADGKFVHIHLPVPQIGEPDAYVSLNAEGNLQKYSQHPAAREYDAMMHRQQQQQRESVDSPNAHSSENELDS